MEIPKEENIKNDIEYKKKDENLLNVSNRNASFGNLYVLHQLAKQCHKPLQDYITNSLKNEQLKMKAAHEIKQFFEKGIIDCPYNNDVHVEK